MKHVTALANGVYYVTILLTLVLLAYVAVAVDLNAKIGEAPQASGDDVLILRPIE